MAGATDNAENSGASRLRARDRIPARPEGRDSPRRSGMANGPSSLSEDSPEQISPRPAPDSVHRPALPASILSRRDRRGGPSVQSRHARDRCRAAGARDQSRTTSAPGSRARRPLPRPLQDCRRRQDGRHRHGPLRRARRSSYRGRGLVAAPRRSTFNALHCDGLSGSGLRGRRTVNTAPVPGSLSAVTVPPCASTNWRTMDRPSPLPPVRLLRDFSARQKRSKT